VRLFTSVFLAALCALTSCQDRAYAPWPREMVPGTEHHYPCIKTNVAPKLDGLLEEPVWVEGVWQQNPWNNAPWSEPFLDIEGPTKPDPRYGTWMKMLWDDENLYVAAYIEEPNLWGTMDKPDMVLFHQNDFEIFIDPDGDLASYYEIEFNILGTIFDLYLDKEYRLGGNAHPEWNCEGIQGVVNQIGKANDSTDVDRSWTVEMKIPFQCLRPPKTVTGDIAENIRNGDSPSVGEEWRMNFSRVEWQLEKVGTGYVKKPGTKEDNWVWTPQWAVDMHRLEHWGVVKFTE